MAFAKTGFRTEIGVGGASAAGRRRVVGALRRWLHTERRLAVGVEGVSARCRRRPPEATRTDIGVRVGVLDASSSARGRRAPKMGLH